MKNKTKAKGKRKGNTKAEAAEVKTQSAKAPNYAEQTTVIITTFNEPLLRWTVDNVRRSAPGAKIIVVSDGRTSDVAKMPDSKLIRIAETPWLLPEGVGACRDLGIMMAGTEYIVVIDAHMDFDDGWLDKLIEPLVWEKHLISSTISGVLSMKQRSKERCTKFHAGAVIKTHKERGAFEAIWQESHKPGSIVQCPLGATYAMKKATYEHVNRPWQNAYGWGTSEPTLAMIAWRYGVPAMVVDAVSYHIYRDSTEVPYDFGKSQGIGLRYNKIRLANIMFAGPENREIREDLIGKILTYRFMRQHSITASKYAHAAKKWDKKIIEGFTKTMEEYLEAFPETMNVEEYKKPIPGTIRRTAVDDALDDVDGISNIEVI